MTTTERAQVQAETLALAAKTAGQWATEAEASTNAALLLRGLADHFDRMAKATTRIRRQTRQVVR